MAGIFLMIFSVGLGGHFYNHHFVFAVPCFVALFLGWIRRMHVQEHALSFDRFSLSAVRWWVPTFMIFLAALTQPHINLQARMTDMERDETLLVPLGEQIDRILDRCAVDRYLFLGANGPQPYAYTRHSPAGPLFYQYHYLLDRERPLFRGVFLTSLLDAQFVVFRSFEVGDLRDMVDGYLHEHFTTEPWPCAAGEGSPPPFQFFYRTRV